MHNISATNGGRARDVEAVGEVVCLPMTDDSSLPDRASDSQLSADRIKLIQ